MQASIDISWLQLGLFSLLLLIPIALNNLFKLAMFKQTCVAITRMFIQLLLVGLYLEYIFALDNLWLNILWVVLMIFVGSHSILSKSQLPIFKLIFANSAALACALLPLLVILAFWIIKPQPFYSTQYMIPLAGMLLGNSLSSNIVALQTLFDAFATRKCEYEAAISLGASPYQAAFPFLQHALKKAQAPILASMATTGIVTLPGMMTGQVLGGVTPMIAIKYQLLILIAIFVMLSVSLTITLLLSLQISLSPSGLLKVKTKHK